MYQKTLILRITGFVASLILTLLAYFIIVRPDFFHLEIETAITVILILALVQSMVQLIFFLLWREKGPPWNLGFFISTIGIIATIIVFSIWIMNHLNYNMMP
jgi:cytochrome o ubiquinol oxidase operon protein cyoD